MGRMFIIRPRRTKRRSDHSIWKAEKALMTAAGRVRLTMILASTL